MEDGGKSTKPAAHASGDIQSRSSAGECKGNGTGDTSASCQPLFDFNPGQMASIIRRKAMIKELAASYRAECLFYCQELLELQGKWEQELYTSSPGLAGVEASQGQEIGNLKSASKQEMYTEIVPVSAQRVKQVSSTLSGSNEDVASADIMENSTAASKAPLRRRLIWRSNEREALRRGLLMFGLGRSDRVRNVMHSILKQMRHGLGDVADCCWEFVRVCGLHADQKESSYAERLYEKSKDSVVEVGPEVSSRVGVWERIEKSASGWLKRLMLLDSLGNVVRLCASKETQEAAYNAIDGLRDATSPSVWWGRDADLALLAGVYKHGFGNYDALHSDPQFAAAFKPSLKRGSIKIASERENIEQSSKFGDQHYKDQFHIKDDPENLDTREGDTYSWPDSNTLTRRLRRLVEHISRIEKDSDILGKQLREKPARGWTKREKMELVKVLMIWGLPPMKAVGDRGNYHWQFVRNQEIVGPLKNRNDSDIEACVKSLQREMQQVLESSDTIQDKEHTSITEPASPTIVGPRVLSYKTAVRLKERLELIDALRQAMDLLPADWGHLGLLLSQRNNMPSWWQAGLHDKEMVKGVLTHGFGNWEAIFGDNNLNFRSFESLSEDMIFPDAKACMKRLRFVGNHLRRQLRKLKARRKRHFLEEEKEMTKEPKRCKRTRLIEIPRTSDGRPILPLALTERLTILDLGTIEPERAGFHTDRHIFPIGYTSIRNYASMVNPKGRASYTCTIRDGGIAGPMFSVIPDDSPETVIERDSASGAWAVVCGTSNKLRGVERGKITISGTEMFGLSHPVVCQLFRELPGAERCSTFFPDYPYIGSQPHGQSVSTPTIPSTQDDSEFRDTEARRKSTSSFGGQSEQWMEDSSEETDSSDSFDDEGNGSDHDALSNKMVEEENLRRRNQQLHADDGIAVTSSDLGRIRKQSVSSPRSSRERTFLDINADPEEFESP